MTKAGSGFSALIARSGKRRNLMLIGAVFALSVAAAIGSGAPSAGAEEACSNEAIRVSQHATHLGDCRAWEMVSPTDKNGGEVFAQGSNSIASSDGNAIAYRSKTNFGDSIGSETVGLTSYIARRGAESWLTHAITPTGRPDAFQVFFQNTSTEFFSSDLSRAYVNGYDLPGAADDVPERHNLYLEDTATRGLETISAFQRPGEGVFDYPNFFEFIDSGRVGASDDLHHFAFRSEAQLLPDGAAPGYPNGAAHLYSWDDGTLHLADVLPDGSVAPEGTRQPLYRGVVSADGSRVAFETSPISGAPRQLYQRINHDHTVWVSEPEATDPGEPQTVFFEGMTPDGLSVFFTTAQALVDEDTNGASSLYRWHAGPDPEHEANLTLISGDQTAQSGREGGAGPSPLIGMSDDGEVVYYRENSEQNVMVWHHGSSGVVAEHVGNPNSDFWLQLTNANPGPSRVSADGRWLAFLREVDRNFEIGDLELYDLNAGSLFHLGRSRVIPWMTIGNRNQFVGSRPTYLLDDGRVIFSTDRPLVPTDVNNVFDVYEFNGTIGDFHLLSSGKGSEPSEFVDAAPDGSDVFFVTRQHLVGSDGDTALDLYDARIGGGFTEMEPAASGCSGESCQAGSAPPPHSTAATAAVRAHGNIKRGRRCKARRHTAGHKGRKHCVKRRQSRHRKQGAQKAATQRGGR
jgi:hypothetical protein